MVRVEELYQQSLVCGARREPGSVPKHGDPRPAQRIQSEINRITITVLGHAANVGSSRKLGSRRQGHVEVDLVRPFLWKRKGRQLFDKAVGLQKFPDGVVGQ